MRVLIVTSEWPTDEHPQGVPFLTQQVEFLRNAGLKVTVYPFRGRANPINYAKAWAQLRKQYNLNDFDLIHAHFGQSMLVAWPAPIPIVTTFHGSDVQGFVGANGRPTRTGQILQYISRWAAKQSQESIVVAHQLIPFLPNQTTYHIIPCGIDRQKFAPQSQANARQALNINTDSKLILFLGDPHNPIKRYHLAQEAVELAKKQGVDGTFWPIYGVPHEQIPLYLNACDLFLLTSKHEGSPTVIKEALSCNISIVTTEVGDVKQWLTDNQNCYICQTDSGSEIARGIMQMLDSKNDRSQKTHPIISQLDETVLVQQIINVYQKAIDHT